MNGSVEQFLTQYIVTWNDLSRFCIHIAGFSWRSWNQIIVGISTWNTGWVEKTNELTNCLQLLFNIHSIFNSWPPYPGCPICPRVRKWGIFSILENVDISFFIYSRILQWRPSFLLSSPVASMPFENNVFFVENMIVSYWSAGGIKYGTHPPRYAVDLSRAPRTSPCVLLTRPSAYLQRLLWNVWKKCFL